MSSFLWHMSIAPSFASIAAARWSSMWGVVHPTIARMWGRGKARS